MFWRYRLHFPRELFGKNCHIPEGAYLLLKKLLLEIFSKRGKYPPPLINKAVPKWNIENMTKFFSSPKKGSKKFRNVIRCTIHFLCKKHCRMPLETEKLFYMLTSLLATKLYTLVFMTRSSGFLAEKPNSTINSASTHPTLPSKHTQPGN